MAIVDQSNGTHTENGRYLWAPDYSTFIDLQTYGGYDPTWMASEDGAGGFFYRGGEYEGGRSEIERNAVLRPFGNENIRPGYEDLKAAGLWNLGDFDSSSWRFLESFNPNVNLQANPGALLRTLAEFGQLAGDQVPQSQARMREMMQGLPSQFVDAFVNATPEYLEKWWEYSRNSNVNTPRQALKDFIGLFTETPLGVALAAYTGGASAGAGAGAGAASAAAGEAVAEYAATKAIASQSPELGQLISLYNLGSSGYGALNNSGGAIDLEALGQTGSGFSTDPSLADLGGDTSAWSNLGNDTFSGVPFGGETFVDPFDMLPDPSITYQTPEALNLPLSNGGLTGGALEQILQSLPSEPTVNQVGMGGTPEVTATATGEGPFVPVGGDETGAFDQFGSASAPGSDTTIFSGSLDNPFPADTTGAFDLDGSASAPGSDTTIFGGDLTNPLPADMTGAFDQSGSAASPTDPTSIFDSTPDPVDSVLGTASGGSTASGGDMDFSFLDDLLSDIDTSASNPFSTDPSLFDLGGDTSFWSDLGGTPGVGDAGAFDQGGSTTGPGSDTTIFGGTTANPLPASFMDQLNSLPAAAKAQLLRLIGGGGNASTGGTGAAAGGAARMARILRGDGTLEDYLSVGGSALPGVIGAIASNRQAKSLEALQREYMAMGAPYRGRLADLYANPSGYLSSPDVQAPVQQGTDALARALSIKGNPAGSGGALQELQNYASNQLYGRLGQEKDRLAGFGGLTAYNSAAPGAAAGAIGARAGVANALGGAAADVFNPPTSLEELLKRVGKSGGAQLSLV